MAIDVSGLLYWTGHPGVVLLNDPVDTVEQVARAYGIRWVATGPGDGVPLSDQLAAGNRPVWVGEPVLRTDGVSLYPVCTEPADTRCGPATP